MQDKKFRAFFALDLPEEIKQKVAQSIKLLQQKNPGENIIWTDSKKLHITLKFLGEISPEQCEKFLPKIIKIITAEKKFILEFTEINLFPKKRTPRMIAWDVSLTEHLTALAVKIEHCVLHYDIAAETRAFKPHLTLARIKRPIKAEFQNILAPPLAFEVERITLFRSEPTPTGSHYEILQHIPLS